MSYSERVSRVLGAKYIRSLDGDSECLEALAWLAENVKGYTPGGFTPPLTPKKRAESQAPFLTLSLRIGRRSRLGAGARVSRVEWFDGKDAHEAGGSDEQIAKGTADRLFTSANSGHIFVTSGQRRGALDTWLDSQGRLLLERGFTLQPCLSGGGVSWCIVRRKRQKWTLAYFETMTGAESSTGLSYAGDAEPFAATSAPLARSLYVATSAVARLYLDVFGVALSPTVGMSALSAARVTLPRGFQKWRPPPLLVAMERAAYGYRGGMTYAQRYRGPSTRIDVNRQYTAALASDLPLQWAFGRFPGFADGRTGVYMCRVRIGKLVPYPVGYWRGDNQGFTLSTVPEGEYVCVLHTAEIRAIQAGGGIVWPDFGYTATATFTLEAYVAKLQAIIREHGRDSAIAKLTKPLGNYVYGKFGQNPKRMELLWSADYPGDQWYPYADETGKLWDNIWERPVEKYSAGQHVDIAGTITAYARAQTCRMWLSLLASGYAVVRCHTDSLTIDGQFRNGFSSDGATIGSWRMESEAPETVIVGANAYFDENGAHIAGISEPTYDMVERMLDGQVVGVQQRMKRPRRGYERGDEMSERKLRATGR